MKKLREIACLLFGLISLAAPVLAASGVPSAVLKAADSVVNITTESDEYYGGGSGFVVAHEGSSTYILTNYHLFEDSPYDVEVWLSEDNSVYADIIANSEEQDLCLLRIAGHTRLPVAVISPGTVSRGDPVYAVGFPIAADDLSDREAHASSESTITDGILSAFRETTIIKGYPPVELLQVTAAINSGNSGGPLFDSKGRVVGVNTYGTYDSQAIFGAISAVEVETFLRANGITPKHPSPFPAWLMFTAAAVIVLSLAGLFLAKRRKKPTEMTLRGFIESRPEPMQPGDAVSLLMPAAVQLQSLHESGRSYLELTPDRIIISGSAVQLANPTGLENNKYTSGFASPEVYRGVGNPLSDVYSFCAVMYFAVTGAAPENALSRTGSASAGGGFMGLLETGMSPAPERRFQSMAALIAALSSFVPSADIASDGAGTPKSENTPAGSENLSAAASRNKKRFKPRQKITAFVLLALCLCGVYLGMFFNARAAALRGDFQTASRLMPLKFVTHIHSPRLTDYVIAGTEMENGEYESAAAAFIALEDYLDSPDMALEARYLCAADRFEAGDFDGAVEMYQLIADKSYKDSVDRMIDAYIAKGLYMIHDEKDTYNGYSYLIRLSKYYPAIAEVVESEKQYIYAKSISLYCGGDYEAAGKCFFLLGDYKDTSKYRLLIEARNIDEFTYRSIIRSAVNKMLQSFSFEDTDEVLVYNQYIAEVFLEGTWKTDDGYLSLDGTFTPPKNTYYLVMSSSGDISYSAGLDIPDGYYKIDQGVLYFYSEEDREEDAQPLFKISPSSPDTVSFRSLISDVKYYFFRQ